MGENGGGRGLEFQKTGDIYGLSPGKILWDSDVLIL